MQEFFRKFLKKHKGKIVFFSFLRIVSFVQVLFWPFALSQVVNIMTETPEKWQGAMMWVLALVINNVAEDLIRLRSKYGLEKLGSKLQINLTRFFSEETELHSYKKTGEAMEAIRKAGEYINALMLFYKEDALRLPVNFIVIPLVLANANKDYLILLVAYALLYLMIDRFAIRIFGKKLKTMFKKSEVFWGTAYRKAPDVWRQREDGAGFASEIDQEGEELYQATIDANNTDKWRWFALQALSSISVCGAIFFVLYKMANNHTHVGDLVLVSSYFQQMQVTLNVITSAFTHVVQTKITLGRLNRAVKIK